MEISNNKLITTQEEYKHCYAPFIQKNVRYYGNKFAQINSEIGLTWNWSAFFFGLFWMLYRKLYTAGLIYVAIHWLVNGILGAIIEIEDAIALAEILLHVLLGIFSNRIYKYHIDRLCGKAATHLPEKRGEFYKRKGGVNWILLSIIIIIEAAMTYAIIAYIVYIFLIFISAG